MEDQQIIELYWARSEQAIRESETKYGAFCLSIARNILAQEQDAEECVNDTWLRAWNAMPPQRPASCPPSLENSPGICPWTGGGITGRPNGRAPGGDGPGGAGGVHPRPRPAEDRLEERETAALISRFLREQPQLDRVLFLRRYWYLDSVAALAERFSMNENTVKSRLHRTRLRLKEVLLREGVAV